MIGLVVLLSGYLIDTTGTDALHPNYRTGFILGAITATIGFILIMIHGWMGREKKQAALANELLPLAQAVPVPAQNQP